MNRKHVCAILTCVSSLWAAGCGGGGVSTGSGGGSNPNPTSSFAFYLSGIEEINGGPNFYALAGSVAIDMTTGRVVDGEQDYNDAVGVTAANGTITGGMLTVNSTTGQGTLTLTTNNGNLGANGTETLAVQFVNSKHALIVQFDGSATSSGSLDLQTLSSTLSGGFSFTFTGFDSSVNANPLALGGVFTVSGTSISNSEFDFNDGGNGVAVLAQSFNSGATISAPDSFGRGSITDTGIASSIIYYTVGPECIRIIDMDTADLLIGSAYGQGSGNFSASSLGSSVFGIEGNPVGALYAAAGRFSTTPTASPAAFTGVGDNDEAGTVASGATISGTYTISANGYGSMTFTTAIEDVSFLGIYMTDPNLNLNDPNNTTTGLGGALVVDLDGPIPAGTGVLVPQRPASFAGNYAFGAQDFFGGGEFDFVGQGAVTDGALSGTGDISDPADAFNGTTATDTGVSFSGTATPDGVNAGRYTMNPVAIQISGGTPQDFTVVVYQADGGQLFWLNEDSDSLWLGPLEQQPANPTFPLARTTRN